MKTISTIIFLIVGIISCYGQTLGQDSNGFSSILLPSTNINIDGKNNVINVSFYKLLRLKKYEPLKGNSINKCFVKSEFDDDFFNNDNISICIEEAWKKIEDNYKEGRMLLGTELSGSSKSGLAIIFGEGLLANTANANVVMGYQKRKIRYDRSDMKDYISAKLKIDTINSLLKANEKSINKNVQLLLVQESVTEANASLLNISRSKSLTEGSKLSTENLIKKVEKQLERLQATDEITRITERKSELQDYEHKIDDIIKLIDSAISDLSGKFPISIQIDAKKAYLFQNQVKFTIKEFNQITKDNEYEKTDLDIKLTDISKKKTWEDAKRDLKKKKKEISLRKRIINDIDMDKIDVVFNNLENNYKDYIKNLKALDTEQKKIKQIYVDNADFNKHVFYGKLGFVGKSFLYDLDNGSNKKDDRIKERTFQGTRFELGWTHQFLTNNVLGVNFSKTYTDNSNMLTSTDYTFKVIDTSVTPNLESSSELKALSGAYDRFNKFQVALDYVRFLPLKEINNANDQKNPAELFLLLNPYFRHNFYNSSETLKPNTSFGIGLYAYSSKNNSLAGGMFAQADDVFNINRESPISFTRQIQIGLVLRYAIDSFKPEKQ